MNRFVLAFATALTAGAGVACTSTAGPFITQIRPLAPGWLSVEKCYVEYTKFDASISNKDCYTESIPLGPVAPQQGPMPMRAPPPGVPVE